MLRSQFYTVFFEKQFLSTHNTAHRRRDVVLPTIAASQLCIERRSSIEALFSPRDKPFAAPKLNTQIDAILERKKTLSLSVSLALTPILSISPPERIYFMFSPTTHAMTVLFENKNVKNKIAIPSNQLSL